MKTIIKKKRIERDNFIELLGIKNDSYYIKTYTGDNADGMFYVYSKEDGDKIIYNFDLNGVYNKIKGIKKNSIIEQSIINLAKSLNVNNKTESLIDITVHYKKKSILRKIKEHSNETHIW